VPPHLPLSRTRSEQFDELVLDAIEALEERWADEVSKLEFAVEDVPPPEAIADDVIPLSQLVPATPDERGRPQAPRIIVYRRPLEARSTDPLDLADLVLDVVVDELARHLGLDPEVVDPRTSGG
jgi:predicted Zn-dependent protease with MMP-like domain